MAKKRKLVHFLLILLIVQLIFINCGLFFPDDPEGPVEESYISDPVNFKEAMWLISNKEPSFAFHDYEFLFYEKFDYRDVMLPDEKFSKKRILSRLNTIERKYGKIDDEYHIQVLWNRKNQNDNDPEFDIEKEKELELATRKYAVFLIKSISNKDTVFSFMYEGEADFKVKYDRKYEEWQISEWIDKKTSGDEKKPFFHPEFD